MDLISFSFSSLVVFVVSWRCRLRLRVRLAKVLRINRVSKALRSLSETQRKKISVIRSLKSESLLHIMREPSGEYLVPVVDDVPYTEMRMRMNEPPTLHPFPPHTLSFSYNICILYFHIFSFSFSIVFVRIVDLVVPPINSPPAVDFNPQNFKDVVLSSSDEADVSSDEAERVVTSIARENEQRRRASSAGTDMAPSEVGAAGAAVPSYTASPARLTSMSKQAAPFDSSASPAMRPRLQSIGGDSAASLAHYSLAEDQAPHEPISHHLMSSAERAAADIARLKSMASRKTSTSSSAGRKGSVSRGRRPSMIPDDPEIRKDIAEKAYAEAAQVQS
jgi:hypothetical protein